MQYFHLSARWEVLKRALMKWVRLPFFKFPPVADDVIQVTAKCLRAKTIQVYHCKCPFMSVLFLHIYRTIVYSGVELRLIQHRFSKNILDFFLSVFPSIIQGERSNPPMALAVLPWMSGHVVNEYTDASAHNQFTAAAKDVKTNTSTTHPLLPVIFWSLDDKRWVLNTFFFHQPVSPSTGDWWYICASDFQHFFALLRRGRLGNVQSLYYKSQQFVSKRKQSQYLLWFSNKNVLNPFDRK